MAPRHARKASSKDALCCCEYVNEKGNTSHILACCCDCEALDYVFDRIFTCNNLPEAEVNKMFDTIEDRCRIPWCSGGGALQIKLDIAFPIILIPTCTLLATINFYFSVLCIIGLPIMLLFFYRLWMKRQKKARTKLFYVAGLTGSLQMYYTFEFVVVGFREVLLWENLLLSTIFGLMFYFLYLAKRDPGALKRDMQGSCNEQFQRKKEDLIKQLKKPLTNAEMEDREPQDGNDGGETSVIDPNVALGARMFVHNLGFDAEAIAENWEEQEEALSAGIVPESQVTWVDSRSLKDGILSTYCSNCRLKKPARSGHCPVCNICVESRDHHCVWIDSCVGARNHRSFFIALCLYVICGAYGTHLTLTTVCTPEMYLDWFLYPNDCRYVYTDFPTALSFVSACLTIIFVIGMGMMLLEQIILISQNITSQELANASKRGWVRYGYVAKNNLNNHGFCRNWMDFLSGRRNQYHLTDKSVIPV